MREQVLTYSPPKRRGFLGTPDLCCEKIAAQGFGYGQVT